MSHAHPTPAGTSEHEEKIKQLLMQRPFKPFEVVLITGHRYQLRRPFSLAIGPRSMAPAERPPGSPLTFAKDSIAEVNLLSEDAA